MANKNFKVKNSLEVSGTITINGNAVNSANSIVVLDATGKLPALDGSNLTGIATTVTPGEQSYTTPGTYSWVCPVGVNSVSVVCIGAGGSVSYGNNCGGGGAGLGWKNNISVTPGSSYTVVVGLGYASPQCSSSGCGTAGGDSYFINTSTVRGGGGGGGCGNNVGGTYTGDGGGNGGSAVGSGVYGDGTPGHGGGAGGYSGAGGSIPGDTVNGSPGSGGAGAGGCYSSGNTYGGGVGLYGQGVSGSTCGMPGSGGTGATYGGGAGGGTVGQGAVRIIWGTGRSFPNNAT